MAEVHEVKQKVECRIMSMEDLKRSFGKRKGTRSKKKS